MFVIVNDTDHTPFKDTDDLKEVMRSNNPLSWHSLSKINPALLAWMTDKKTKILPSFVLTAMVRLFYFHRSVSPIILRHQICMKMCITRRHSYAKWIWNPYLISPIKWGHIDRAKPILKILLAFWTFYTILNGFRSFSAEK